MGQKQCALALALAVAWVGSASADDTGLAGAWLGKDNTFYIGGGFQIATAKGYNWTTLPRRDAPNGNPISGNVLNFETGDTVTGGSGHLGFVFPARLLPRWLGTGFRVEISGGYTRGKSQQSRDETPTRAFAVLPLDGSFVLANNAFPVRYAGDQTVRNEGESVGFKIASDFNIVGRVWLTPSLHVGYSKQETKLATYYVADQILFPGYVFPVDLQETLTRRSVKGTVGLHLTYRASSRLAIFAGGRVGVSWTSAKYGGQDCFGTDPAPAPCNGYIMTSVEDRAHRTGLTAGVTGGISVFLFNRVILSTVFEAQYESSLMRIRYPNEVDRRAASIEFQSGWSLGGRVSLTIPFHIGG